MRLLGTVPGWVSAVSKVIPQLLKKVCWQLWTTGGPELSTHFLIQISLAHSVLERTPFLLEKVCSFQNRVCCFRKKACSFQKRVCALKIESVWQLWATVSIPSFGDYSFNCLAVFQQLWKLIRVGRTVHGTVDGKCRISVLDRFNGLFVVGSTWIFYNRGSPILIHFNSQFALIPFEGSRRSPKLTYSCDKSLVLSFTKELIMVRGDTPGARRVTLRDSSAPSGR